MALSSFDLTPAFMKGLSIHLIKQALPLLTGARRAHYGMILNQLARLLDDGAIRPLIDPNEFTICQVAKAHAHLESGKAIGKVVLKAGW